MKAESVWIVREHTERNRAGKNCSIWWTETDAIREVEKEAAEDALVTGRFTHLEVRTLVVDERWVVQRKIHPGRAQEHWVTLRHYSIQKMEVRGTAVDRLAELTR